MKDAGFAQSHGERNLSEQEEGGSHGEMHRSGARSWWSLVCKSQVDQGRWRQEGRSGAGFVEEAKAIEKKATGGAKETLFNGGGRRGRP